MTTGQYSGTEACVLKLYYIVVVINVNGGLQATWPLKYVYLFAKKHVNVW